MEDRDGYRQRKEYQQVTVERFDGGWVGCIWWNAPGVQLGGRAPSVARVFVDKRELLAWVAEVCGG